jgi:hypothetical protein
MELSTYIVNDCICIYNPISKLHIYKSRFRLYIRWIRNKTEYCIEVEIPADKIYKHIKSPYFEIYQNWYENKYTYRTLNHDIVYRKCRLSYSFYIFSREISVSVINRSERIQLMAKELLFCKRKKQLRECIKNFRKKRAKRIMEEGMKYLIPDICNMIVEMVQR